MLIITDIVSVAAQRSTLTTRAIHFTILYIFFYRATFGADSDEQFHRGNDVNQLVNAFSCAPFSYDALGKFGEHSAIALYNSNASGFRVLQTFRVHHKQPDGAGRQSMNELLSKRTNKHGAIVT